MSSLTSYTHFIVTLTRTINNTLYYALHTCITLFATGTQQVNDIGEASSYLIHITTDYSTITLI